MSSNDWRDRRKKLRSMMLESVIRSMRDEAERDEEIAVLTETRKVAAYPGDGSIMEIDGVSFETDRVTMTEGAGITVEAGISGPGGKPDECVTYIRLEDAGTSLFRPDAEEDWLTLTLKGERELDVAIAAFSAVAKLLERQKAMKGKG